MIIVIDYTIVRYAGTNVDKDVTINSITHPDQVKSLMRKVGDNKLPYYLAQDGIMVRRIGEDKS